MALHNKFPLGQVDVRPAKAWAEGTVSKEHLEEEFQSPWRCPSTCVVTAAWPTVCCKQGKTAFLCQPI